MILSIRFRFLICSSINLTRIPHTRYTIGWTRNTLRTRVYRLPETKYMIVQCPSCMYEVSAVNHSSLSRVLCSIQTSPLFCQKTRGRELPRHMDRVRSVGMYQLFTHVRSWCNGNSMLVKRRVHYQPLQTYVTLQSHLCYQRNAL